ncbi:hypothetical protein FB451DRAFT_1176941 [Mycena latifolia]|nr:hypothetical protein FB451DRAFT_1176941 [Mycena latifolia]
MVCSCERQTAPVVVNVFIRHTYIYKGMVTAWISAPTTFSDGDWLSIMLLLLQGTFQETFQTVTLLPRPDSKARSHVCWAHRAFPYGGHRFEVPLTNMLIIRFVRFATVGDVIEDVPFMSLFADNPTLTPETPHSEGVMGAVPCYAISWEGWDTLCIVYRDAEPETQKTSRRWFIKLENDVLIPQAIFEFPPPLETLQIPGADLKDDMPYHWHDGGPKRGGKSHKGFENFTEPAEKRAKLGSSRETIYLTGRSHKSSDKKPWLVQGESPFCLAQIFGNQGQAKAMDFRPQNVTTRNLGL